MLIYNTKYTIQHCKNIFKKTKYFGSHTATQSITLKCIVASDSSKLS